MLCIVGNEEHIQRISSLVTSKWPYESHSQLFAYNLLVYHSQIWKTINYKMECIKCLWFPENSKYCTFIFMISSYCLWRAVFILYTKNTNATDWMCMWIFTRRNRDKCTFFWLIWNGMRFTCSRNLLQLALNVSNNNWHIVAFHNIIWQANAHNNNNDHKHTLKAWNSIAYG